MATTYTYRNDILYGIPFSLTYDLQFQSVAWVQATCFDEFVFQTDDICFQSGTWVEHRTSEAGSEAPMLAERFQACSHAFWRLEA
jgi:hypothetical protein